MTQRAPPPCIQCRGSGYKDQATVYYPLQGVSQQMPPSPSRGTVVVIDSSRPLCYIITKATAANQSLVLETESQERPVPY